MFITYASENPRFYVMWVFTVIVSIVLHELAHGWMAIRFGDDTPRHLGRMTGNPLVHMGGFSIVILLFLGIAWGQMPIDPTRLRGRFAEAAVAAAGPATNLVLALAALLGLGLWERFGEVNESIDFQANLSQFLFLFGAANLMLCVFNLLPVPPLDGSRIAANFHHGYARFVSDPHNQQYLIFGFIFAFMVAGVIFDRVGDWARAIVVIVAG